MSSIAWLIVAFLVGVGCGATLRESYEILIGRHQPMDMLKRALHVRVPVLTIALVVSLLLNMAVGVVVIVNDKNYGADVACQVEYNRLTAKARDARTSASGDATGAEISYVEEELDYQRGLLLTVTSDDGTVDDLTATIQSRIAATQDYLDALKSQDQVRSDNEYPAADYCTRRDR